MVAAQSLLGRSWHRFLEACRVERCDQVVGLDCDRGHGEERRRVIAVREKGVAVLEQSHGPAVFLPGQQTVPRARASRDGLSAVRTVDAKLAVAVHFARFHHGGEEDIFADADGSESFQLTR